MRRLILFRHGKADVAGLAGGDQDRPLTARGRADSARTADWLRAAGYLPDLALLSPSLRTRMTWDCAVPAFSGAKAEARQELYLAAPETILQVAQAAPPAAGTVIVVGHNPGLQELAVELAAAGEAPAAQICRLAEGFPTAAVAAFGISDDRRPVLEAIYEPPREPGDPPRWMYCLQSGARA
jgi:phosphohistidine phosphatase